eukprot:RCo047820
MFSVSIRQIGGLSRYWALGRLGRFSSGHAVSEVTTLLLKQKAAKHVSFADLGKALGRDEVWVASVLYRQNSASLEESQKLCAALGVTSAAAVEELTTRPVKGSGPVVPTDPLIYRFYEIIQVYGFPLKDVIQEKFGDGIMSAIDFTMHVDKVEDPKGDRVKLTMNGKFLPYKKW